MSYLFLDMIRALTGAQCAFAVKMFYKTGEFIIDTERAFYAHFMIH